MGRDFRYKYIYEKPAQKNASDEDNSSDEDLDWTPWEDVSRYNYKISGGTYSKSDLREKMIDLANSLSASLNKAQKNEDAAEEGQEDSTEDDSTEDDQIPDLTEAINVYSKFYKSLTGGDMVKIRYD